MKLSGALSALPLRLLQRLSRVHLEELVPVSRKLAVFWAVWAGNMLPHIIPDTVGVEHLVTSKGTQEYSKGKLKQVLGRRHQSALIILNCLPSSVVKCNHLRETLDEKLRETLRDILRHTLDRH